MRRQASPGRCKRRPCGLRRSSDTWWANRRHVIIEDVSSILSRAERVGSARWTRFARQAVAACVAGGCVSKTMRTRAIRRGRENHDAGGVAAGATAADDHTVVLNRPARTPSHETRARGSRAPAQSVASAAAGAWRSASRRTRTRSNSSRGPRICNVLYPPRPPIQCDTPPARGFAIKQA